VQRVYEQCLKAQNIDEVYIATDSPEVVNSCQAYTQNVILTDTKHESGTDRIAEVVKQIDCDLVVNVQGDELFIEPELIEQLVNALKKDSALKMSSAMHRIEQVSDLKNPSVVKVTATKNNATLYFAHSIIPHHRDEWESLLNYHTKVPASLNFYRHLGIYGYSKDFLIAFSKMQPRYLEHLEKLEQLRVLENGFAIQMIETSYNSIGIDTQEDYEKALRLFEC